MKEPGNFVNSAIKVATAGFELSASDLKIERLRICSKCRDYDEEKRRCLLCGCRMDIKAAFETMSCPSGRW